MKNFVNRPIPRLARYELLLKGIMEASKEHHEDHGSIPQVIEVIKSLLKETQPGVASAEQKVELWRYNSNLVFKPGEAVVRFNFTATEVKPTHIFPFHPRRIWTCWARIARSFIRASSCASRILGSNGVVGASSSFCYLITTVSRGDRRTFSGMESLVTDCDFISVVMTKPKEKDGVTKYHVNRRVCIFVPFLYSNAKG
jgi:hypothetical protein